MIPGLHDKGKGGSGGVDYIFGLIRCVIPYFFVGNESKSVQ